MKVFLCFLLMVATSPLLGQVQVLEDDLLDRLAGRWEMTGSVHGKPSTQVFAAEWVLNHQYLRISETTAEKIEPLNAPFEAVLYIGYDNVKKQYVLHNLNVWGAGRPGEFAYGQRNGNEIEFNLTVGDKAGLGRFTWLPDSKTWRYTTGLIDSKGNFKPSVELISAPAH
jgi:hypothetical protein